MSYVYDNDTVISEDCKYNNDNDWSDGNDSYNQTFSSSSSCSSFDVSFEDSCSDYESDDEPVYYVAKKSNGRKQPFGVTPSPTIHESNDIDITRLTVLPKPSFWVFKDVKAKEQNMGTEKIESCGDYAIQSDDEDYDLTVLLKHKNKDHGSEKPVAVQNNIVHSPLHEGKDNSDFVTIPYKKKTNAACLSSNSDSNTPWKTVLPKSIVGSPRRVSLPDPSSEDSLSTTGQTSKREPNKNVRTNLLCRFHRTHSTECRSVHSFNEWTPTTCRFDRTCRKSQHCIYFHPSWETKDGFFDRLTSVENISYIYKFRNHYRKTYSR